MIITSYYPKLYFHVIPVISLLHPRNIHKSHLHPTTFLAVFFGRDLQREALHLGKMPDDVPALLSLAIGEKVGK